MTSSQVQSNPCALHEIENCSHVSDDLDERAEHLYTVHADFFNALGSYREAVDRYLIMSEHKRQKDSMMICPCGKFVANAKKPREKHMHSCSKLMQHVSTLHQIAEANEDALPNFVEDINVEEVSHSRLESTNIWCIEGKRLKARDFGSQVTMRANGDTNVCFYKSVLMSSNAEQVLALKEKLSLVATAISFPRGKPVENGAKGIL